MSVVYNMNIIQPNLYQNGIILGKSPGIRPTLGMKMADKEFEYEKPKQIPTKGKGLEKLNTKLEALLVKPKRKPRNISFSL